MHSILSLDRCILQAAPPERMMSHLMNDEQSAGQYKTAWHPTTASRTARMHDVLVFSLPSELHMEAA